MLQPCFDPFPLLHTPRLELRAVTLSDSEALFRMRSDPEVMRYIGKTPYTSIEEASQFIGQIQELLQNTEGITWAISLKGKPELIGTIGLWRILKAHYRAEIGYMLRREYWGKGYIQEALKTVIEYGFGQLRLHSIEAQIDPLNTVSEKLLEKNGFVREAYFRENFYFEGEFIDTAVYSLLIRPS